MKRFAVLILVCLLALLLCACHGLGQKEYYSITPHEEQDPSVDDTEAVLVENYPELKNAILAFVENGVEYGVIRIYNYVSGDVEKDVAKATYDVSKNNPLGAYAVDYMTHECNLIVSYYEIHIETTFRRTVEDIRAIRQVSSKQDLQDAVVTTLNKCAGRLTVRTPYYISYDVQEMVEEHYTTHPELVVEVPEISISLYPEEGDAKIIEINFQYENTLEQLLEKKADIATNVSAAAQYVSYRSSDWEKLQLLYTYLQGRFTYIQGQTANPVYSALCEGIADDEGFARAMELICRQLGIEAAVTATEEGNRIQYGNLVTLDGVEYAIDVARDILSGAQLELYSQQQPTPPGEGPDALQPQPSEELPPEAPVAPEEPPADPGSEQPEEPGQTQPTEEQPGKIEPEA